MVEPGPAFSVADCHRGWMRAFSRLGCEVKNVNFGDRLEFYDNAKMERDGETRKAFSFQAAIEMAAKGIEVAAFEWWPDIVFITSGFFVPPFVYEVLRARKMKVVLFHTESPYEDFSKQLPKAPYADLNLLNDPTNLERFKEVAPTEYFPHAYDPEIHHPREPKDDLRSDFFFVGTGYPSRIEFLEAVDWGGVDAKLGGNWQFVKEDTPLHPFLIDQPAYCLENTDAADYYASTKVSANLYRQETYDGDSPLGWAMTPREVEMAAIGTFFLRESRGEGDEVLKSLPIFNSPEDFSEKLRWYLAHPGQRADLAERAQAAVADRTFTNSAVRLLHLLEN